jgi:hypothetical protein
MPKIFLALCARGKYLLQFVFKSKHFKFFNQDEILYSVFLTCFFYSKKFLLCNSGAGDAKFWRHMKHSLFFLCR